MCVFVTHCLSSHVSRYENANLADLRGHYFSCFISDWQPNDDESEEEEEEDEEDSDDDEEEDDSQIAQEIQQIEEDENFVSFVKIAKQHNKMLSYCCSQLVQQIAFTVSVCISFLSIPSQHVRH